MGNMLINCNISKKSVFLRPAWNTCGDCLISAPTANPVNSRCLCLFFQVHKYATTYIVDFTYLYLILLLNKFRNFSLNQLLLSACETQWLNIRSTETHKRVRSLSTTVHKHVAHNHQCGKCFCSHTQALHLHPENIRDWMHTFTYRSKWPRDTTTHKRTLWQTQHWC